MTTQNSPMGLEPYRWSAIMATLSLDIAQPYIGSMGLQLPPDGSFLDGLRRIITDYRALEGESIAPQQPFPEAVLAWARSQYGESFADALHQWGSEVFQYSGTDGVSSFLWSCIVHRGRLDGTRDTGPVPDFIRLVRQYLKSTPKPVFSTTAPTTEWDQHLYARQGYDAQMNPLEWVEATINHRRFLLAWQRALEEAGETADLSTVETWGRNQAKQMGMPLQRLGKPGVWTPLPQL